MSHLTVAEKEHWKARIDRRIDKRIEALCAVDPNLMDRIQRQAREQALQSTGLTDFQRELDDIDAQEESLEKRKQQVHKAMLARVQGKSVDEVDFRGYYGEQSSEVTEALQRRQAVHEDELLALDQTGQEVLRLRKEKEDLLDTVWLATSEKQIKELWQKVAQLLGEQPSSLQQEALAITSTES